MLWIVLLVLPGLAWALAESGSDNSDLFLLRGTLRGRDFGLKEVLINRLLEEEKGRQRTQLVEAKFHILNGKTRKARESLMVLAKSGKTDYQAMAHRYLALIEFQEGRWKEALAHLQVPELTQIPNYGRICPLKTVLRVVVKDVRGLNEEWIRCKQENISDVLARDMVWMDTLVTLATRNSMGPVRANIKRYNPINLSNEDLRTIVKLALYLNIEDLIVGEIENLDYSVIEDEELRALMAHVYYRKGRLADAWKLMEDLYSTNINNIKGNLWILRENQELAYAEFKLALKRKANSHNAIERALPLAWSLKQWKDGAKLAESIYTHEKNRKQQLTTTAAFSVANGQFKEANERLELVQRLSGEGTAAEVSQLSTYVAIRLNDKKVIERHARNSCESGDLISCWILSSRFSWPELPTLVTQSEGFEPAPKLWRTLASEEAPAFKDEEFIDQRDIDELDDALIKLVK